MYDINKSHTVTLSVKKIMSVLVPFMPILLYYDIPLTSLNCFTTLSFIVGMYCALLYVNNRTHITVGNPYILLVGWTLLVTLMAWALNNYQVGIGIGLVNIVFVLFVILGVINGYLDKSSLLKTYLILAKIVVLMLGIEWLFYIITGYGISFVLHFLPTTESYAGYLPTFIYKVSALNFNFSACFSERSHAAMFLIPYLGLCLGNIKNNHKYFRKALIVSVAILSTVSGNGIVACGICWIVFAFLSDESRSIKRIFSILGICVLVIIAYQILKTIPAFSSIFDRLFANDSGNIYTHSKADYRVYRGFAVYWKLPFFEKITGIGYRCLLSAINYFNLFTQYDLGEPLEYMNCIAQILVYSGMAGASMFLTFMFRLFKRNSLSGRIICIAFLALSCSSSIYNDAVWIFFLSLIAVLYDTGEGSIVENYIMR